VHSDVLAFDQPGFRSQNDPTTGETIVPSQDDELTAGIVGFVWNDHCATMTRYAGQGKSMEELTLGHFANVVSLCPEGAILMFQTHSAWLVSEWDTIVQWRERGYDGLASAECAESWTRIMRDVENGHQRAQVCVGTGEKMPVFKEAVMKYIQEVVSHLEEDLVQPIDAYTPPVPPGTEG
jgi:hypothetical protein